MFTDDIKDFITDRLPNYEGQNFYGADLAHQLTLDENNDGCWFPMVDDARRYIECNAIDALDTVAYFADELDMRVDVRNYPLLTFFMLYRGVNEMLPQAKFIDEHWNDEFTLDADAIAAISKQINEL